MYIVTSVGVVNAAYPSSSPCTQVQYKRPKMAELSLCWLSPRVVSWVPAFLFFEFTFTILLICLSWFEDPLLLFYF